MNIEDLRMFCDVVRHQSFSRAAAINHVSQSAATQCIHRLEKRFGTPLVDRSRRPFILTPEGQVCYEGFREVLDLYDAVESRVRSLRKEIAGVVRVAAIYSVGLFEMGWTMRDFMRRYPKARVRLQYHHPSKVYQAVLDSEVDLGIVSYPTSSSELVVMPLRSEPMVVVCHPDDPLTAHATVTLEHLRGREFVAFDRDLSIRKELDRHFRQRSVSVRIVMEFDNIETIKQAIEIRAGVSILPAPTVRREVETGTLRAIPLIAPAMVRPIGIIHRHRKVFSPTVTKFVEMLLEKQGGTDQRTAAPDEEEGRHQAMDRSA
ncbi:MAG TPA: LysR family transcriptional regulator [Planctomycetes bacterium]|nr:LysR family transcriptional regulator [Planctomycetota bacterium]